MIKGDLKNIQLLNESYKTNFIKRCTFKTGGKAILVYREGDGTTNIDVEGCIFLDNDALDTEQETVKKAAVETGKHDDNFKINLVLKNNIISGFALNDEGTSTGTKMYGNKNSMDAEHLTVTLSNNVEDATIPNEETTVTTDTTFDLKGVTINLNDVESPYVMTSDNSGAKITLKNATYTGKAEGIYFGNYDVNGTYNFNTQADNITVKDLRVSTNIRNGNNKLSAGVWVYGTFELNNCKMSGTTTTQSECTPYDVVFVNRSKGTVNGGEYDSMFVYTQSEVTLKGAKVGTVACMTNTRVGKKMIIDKDCDIDTIKFVGSDGYVMNIEIEDGAKIGSIIYNGTTYTVNGWNEYVANH